MGMTLSEYATEVWRTTSKGLTVNEVLSVAGLGLAGESGEVADLVKKRVFHGHPMDRPQFIKEMGDVLWYLVFLANALDLTLEEVMEANVEKLRLRYPEGFSTEASIRREDEEEKPGPLAHVLLLSNGMVAAFDVKGRQVPEFQGPYEEVWERIEGLSDVKVEDYRRLAPKWMR